MTEKIKDVSRYWDLDCLKKSEEVAASTKLLSDDCLISVKAQVMTRDDEIVGWVPMGGGGMSMVSLCKRVVSNGEDIKHDYLILGERISDKTAVLNCRLKKDLQYTQATPCFHHWRTEDKRFGLTFQKTADARSFDNGVKRALADLLEGSPESTQNTEMDLGDDEVFVQLELPLGRKDSSSQSASTTSTTTSSPTQQSPAQEPFISQFHHSNHHHLHRIHYMSKQPTKASPSPSSDNSKSISSDTNTSKEDVWVKHEKQSSIQSKSDKTDQGSIDPDTTIEIKDYKADCNKGYYVQFAKNRPQTVNDYSYPQLESVRPSHRKDSLSSLKKIGGDISLQPPLPTKKKSRKGRSRDKKDKGYLLSQKRSRCVYCHEMFVHEDNMKGSCEDAPDKVHECIEKVSCICCARGMLYHCMADADGDYGHPCVCDSADDSNCKKWTALTLLSFFVPCLWCYWPLTACHRCGVACGCCGGRHKAA